MMTLEGAKMKDILKYLIPLQPMIKKAMGERKVGDMFIALPSTDIEFCSSSDIEEDLIPDKFLYVPLTIDPVNPSRGLWGMLTIKGINYIFDNYNFEQLLHSNGMTEAILKALCHQEGVEIK